jgi:hypothetical protein
MPDLSPPTQKVKRRSRWWAWLRAAGFGVQLTLVLALVLYAMHFYQISIQFRAALDDMDKNHPGWRLEEIEKARAVVPDDKNSALRVSEMAKLLPDQWLDDQLESEIEGLLPETQMTPDQLERVQHSLDKVRPALEMSRTLADLPKGRFPIVYGANRSDSSISIAPIRNAIRLPRLEAAARLQTGDVQGAIDSCRSSFAIARSVGDEPTVLPQLTRVALVAITSQTVKRILAQSEPDDAQVSALQKCLEIEGMHPYWSIAWRGERAFQTVSLEAMAKGELIPLDEPDKTLPAWLDKDLAFLLFQDRVRFWGPEFLSWYLRLETTDEMPPHLRQQVLDQMAGNVYKESNVLLLGFHALAIANVAFTRVKALLRSEIAALAAERYRRLHREWPQSLVQLTPDLLSAVPTDPFTGDPLLYRRLPDGVVIYSVGKDGEDNGGNVDSGKTNEPGTDIGIRLWDVAKRRQPPKPEEPAKQP